MNYKLSIITINKNNAEGLIKTIESVVAQIYTDYEYIVIDGESTDGSLDVIKQYSDKISYWVNEPDCGIYNAMNKGVLRAKGEYCLFLNSGDWLVENILLEIFSLSINKDIIYGNIILEFDDNLSIVDKACGKSILTFNDFFTGTIRHQAAFIKRNLFYDFGLYDESYNIVSDWQFFIKTIIFGKVSYQYIDKSISHFDTNGIGSTFTQIHLDEKQRVLNSFLPDCIIKDYSDYNELIKQNVTIDKELKRYKNRFFYIDRFYTFVKNNFRKLYSNLN